MNLHQYLTDILNDKVINLDRFVSLLPARYKQQWRSVFSYEKQNNKNRSHRLMIKDQHAFDVMFAASLPVMNRIEAAVRGDSHREKTSFSYLLVFHQALKTTHNSEYKFCPEVVVINNESVQQNFTSKKQLIIIENQETFFRWQQFLSALTLFCQQGIIPKNTITQQITNTEVMLSDVLNGADIAFGSGNSITDAKNIAFLKQYQHISCYFDYDLGGLTMFKSLKKLCANTLVNDPIKLSFVLPEPSYLLDSTFTERYFNKAPKDSKQWQQAIKLADELGFHTLAQAFNQTKNFMEQESYLAAPFKPQE